MSSTSSDLEMSFDSEDSEINFIRPWIRDSSRTGRVARMSAEFITNFERWRSCCLCWRPTGRQRMDIELPKVCRCRQKTRLDEDLKDRFEGNVEVRNCLFGFFAQKLRCKYSPSFCLAFSLLLTFNPLTLCVCYLGASVEIVTLDPFKTSANVTVL